MVKLSCDSTSDTWSVPLREPTIPALGGGGDHDEIVIETIDASVFKRWRADPNYRPQHLQAWHKGTGVDPAMVHTAVLAHVPNTAVP
ncbi:hypothetical protein [Methylobacterium gregans]|uniref:Uncharacterized protein n=1 Tax=Methylobacterium gregans TaxID=374424 RepID=A0AA37HU74_9HYPH|nr:hypothetical protein [Methylobacterium gregans]MDQ0521650.1 hypothetical protein [Methylobacterium gregans]GJD80968.1 hypothetical protein NBEOAGPD_4213 [Methylobacterium gregans]GLS54913.1 hypothetical protein GCM10007886_30970 [Methylobacterium gregans]